MPGRSTRFTVLAALVLLGGCATRGPLTLGCGSFNPLPVPDSPVVKSIKADQGPSQQGAALVDLSHCAAQEPILRALLAARGGCAEAGPTLLGEVRKSNRSLLLSGGGQWGAFGAGFLKTLHDRRPEYLPRFDIVTGISTGAFQAMFAGLDEYGAIVTGYRINDESEIVDRSKVRELAVITGSIAGLSPLVRRIEQALCSDEAIANGAEEQCAVSRLARSSGDPARPQVFVAFVEADSGDLQYVWVNQLAKDALAKSGVREARRCLAAASLASAAVPVFYQQVRVTRRLPSGQRVTKAYYDGGVRQSVFESSLGGLLQQADTILGSRSPKVKTVPAATRSGRGSALPEDLATFVIRNGPTSLVKDSGPGENADALTAALRAYSIAVNQLEIGAIAALRIEHPNRDIALITADDSAGAGCKKEPDDAMFIRDFMQCLQRFGNERAERDLPEDEGWGPWRRIFRKEAGTSGGPQP